MVHSGDEDDEFCSFWSSVQTELLTKKNTKITKKKFAKFGYGSPWQNRINSIEFDSARFEICLKIRECYCLQWNSRTFFAYWTELNMSSRNFSIFRCFLLHLNDFYEMNSNKDRNIEKIWFDSIEIIRLNSIQFDIPEKF
jgi:hypothetical protein